MHGLQWNIKVQAERIYISFFDNQSSQVAKFVSPNVLLACEKSDRDIQCSVFGFQFQAVTDVQMMQQFGQLLHGQYQMFALTDVFKRGHSFFVKLQTEYKKKLLREQQEEHRRQQMQMKMMLEQRAQANLGNSGKKYRKSSSKKNAGGPTDLKQLPAGVRKTVLKEKQSEIIPNNMPQFAQLGRTNFHEKSMIQQVNMQEIPQKSHGLGLNDEQIQRPDSESNESYDKQRSLPRGAIILQDDQQFSNIRKRNNEQLMLNTENNDCGGGMRSQDAVGHRRKSSDSGGEFSDCNDAHDSINGPYLSHLDAQGTRHNQMLGDRKVPVFAKQSVQLNRGLASQTPTLKQAVPQPSTPLSPQSTALKVSNTQRPHKTNMQQPLQSRPPNKSIFQTSQPKRHSDGMTPRIP